MIDMGSNAFFKKEFYIYMLILKNIDIKDDFIFIINIQFKNVLKYNY